MDDHLDDDSGIEIKQEATEVQTSALIYGPGCS